MGYNGPNWTQEGVGDSGIECGTKIKRKNKRFCEPFLPKVPVKLNF